MRKEKDDEGNKITTINFKLQLLIIANKSILLIE